MVFFFFASQFNDRKKKLRPFHAVTALFAEYDRKSFSGVPPSWKSEQLVKPQRWLLSKGGLRVWKLRCADGQLAGHAQHKGYGARWLMLGRTGDISLIELTGIIYGHFRTSTRAPSWALLWAVLSYVHILVQNRKSHSSRSAESPQNHQSKSFLTIQTSSWGVLYCSFNSYLTIINIIYIWCNDSTSMLRKPG